MRRLLTTSLDGLNADKYFSRDLNVDSILFVSLLASTLTLSFVSVQMLVLVKKKRIRKQKRMPSIFSFLFHVGEDASGQAALSFRSP